MDKEFQDFLKFNSHITTALEAGTNTENIEILSINNKIWKFKFANLLRPTWNSNQATRSKS